MTMDEPAAPPPRRSDWPLILLAVGVVAASGVGALLYSRSQSQARKGFIDSSGFDLDKADAGPAAPMTPGATQAPKAQSGLGMVTGSLPGMRVGAQGGGAAALSPKQAAAQNFTQSCRGSEGAIRALAEDYTRRYPVIQQYGRDWMSYPDLKRLNDDYMRDHDPVKFLTGLAASANFPKLVKKYATSPEIQAFAKDAVSRAPGQVMSAGMDLVAADGAIKQIAESVVSALGLPPGILAAASGGKIDQNAVMNSVIGSNPELQKALQQSQSR